MKVTVIGGGGVRTPLLVRAFLARADRLGLTELALMDIDPMRLELMSCLTVDDERTSPVRVMRTGDIRTALSGADFVITTFRAGGMEARAADERIAVDNGVVGQETVGPGGFAMALRSIPVLLDYVRAMREACPNAWLINFANPSGMLSEAVLAYGDWPRAVGICDSPGGILRGAASVLGFPADEFVPDYFGLNHLGWVRSLVRRGTDHLPGLLADLRLGGGAMPDCPFDADFLAHLGLLPNEYLYYYYRPAEALAAQRTAGVTRGEILAEANARFFADLAEARQGRDREAIEAVYASYLGDRHRTYFTRSVLRIEPVARCRMRPSGKGGPTSDPKPLIKGEDREDVPVARPISGDETAVGGYAQHAPRAGRETRVAGEGESLEEGYTGVALRLVEALSGQRPGLMILNVANRGSVCGMRDDAVVEVPCEVGLDRIRPLAVGQVPGDCLALMTVVKEYERLTIEAASTCSMKGAMAALTANPLVPDRAAAEAILDGYLAVHREYLNLG